jgi:glucosamine-6-phosphate deaminase
MEVIVKTSEAEVAALAAEMIADVIRKKPRAVLGLATGSTPLGTYRELIRMHREEGLDFSQVVTFNLDEYVGLPATHPQSYRYFMNKNLFEHVNIKRESTHLPNGAARDVEAACIEYEREIKEVGGVDMQLLGIGTNGHIAFNEPVSSLGSRTRVKTLTDKTRRDNSRFFGSLAEVPKYAITVGIGTIMEARSAILIATGNSKADAILAAVEGPITAMCPASALQLHPHMTIIVDRQAAAKLTGEYPSEPQKLVL